MDTKVDFDFTSEPEGHPNVEVFTGLPVTTGSWTAAAICMLAGGVILMALPFYGRRLPSPDLTWLAFVADGLLCWVAAALLCRGRLTHRRALTDEERASSTVGVALGPIKVRAKLSPRARVGATGVSVGAGIAFFALNQGPYLPHHDSPAVWLLAAGISATAIVLGTLLAVARPRLHGARRTAKKPAAKRR